VKRWPLPPREKLADELTGRSLAACAKPAGCTHRPAEAARETRVHGLDRGSVPGRTARPCSHPASQPSDGSIPGHGVTDPVSQPSDGSIPQPWGYGPGVSAQRREHPRARGYGPGVSAQRREHPPAVGLRSLGGRSPALGWYPCWLPRSWPRGPARSGSGSAPTCLGA